MKVRNLSLLYNACDSLNFCANVKFFIQWEQVIHEVKYIVGIILYTSYLFEMG